MLNSLFNCKGRGFTQEIEVALFGHCNLHCDFCFQHNTEQAEALSDNISKAAEDIINHLKTLDLRNKKVVNLRTYGGELFTPKTEKYLDDYINYTLKIKEYCDSVNVPIYTHWTTNLVHRSENLRLLYNRLKENNIECRICTSFDFEGRFHNDQMQKWFSNLEYFKDIIKLVVIVQTRPNINHFLKDDSLYKIIYKDFPIMWEHYVPDWNWDVNMPHDEDTLNLYRKLIKEYPKSTPVNAFFLKRNCMTCECANSFRWIDGKIITHCRDMLSVTNPKMFYSDKELTHQQITYINRRKCLLCEYFQRCPLSCWTYRDFKLLKENKECIYKTLFKEIDNV